jgi:hypothetical protein
MAEQQRIIPLEGKIGNIHFIKCCQFFLENRSKTCSFECTSFWIERKNVNAKIRLSLWPYGYKGACFKFFFVLHKSNTRIVSPSTVSINVSEAVERKPHSVVAIL